MKLLLIQIRKSLNKNDWDQVLWACKTELPIQILVFTNTAGHHNLVKVIAKYTLELKLVSNFDAQSIRKHMWHMIFLTFSHNWCFKNSMYLFTGLSIMTVRIFIEILKKEWYVNSLFSSDFQWLLQIPAGDLCRRKIVFSYHLHQQTLRFQHQLSVCPFHLSLLSCFEIWG